eukprot:3589963-Rhodomonas_salina.1
MKFGKRIRTEAVQSWGEHYVDYKVRQSPLQSKWFTQSCPGLKHLLKPLVVKGCPNDLEDEFRAAIIAEIEKSSRAEIPPVSLIGSFAAAHGLLIHAEFHVQVDRFFSGKECELYAEYVSLSRFLRSSAPRNLIRAAAPGQ